METLELILVTNKQNQSIQSYLDFIKDCAKSGITAVQLREKSLSEKDILAFGLQLKELLDSFNIPLIINDDLELCLKVNAHGLHLGQSDGAITEARKALGYEKILGLSTNNYEQVRKANSLPIDYIGVGSIFPTKNKPDIETIWGIEALQEVKNISQHPIVAIGGINHTNVHDVIKAGVSGVAAIEAFHNEFPKESCQMLKRIIQGEKYA